MHTGYLIDQPSPSWLTDLEKNSDQPLCEELIKNALIDSIFYPACGTDGEVIRIGRNWAHSFVYVDNGRIQTKSPQDLKQKINSWSTRRHMKILLQVDLERDQLTGPISTDLNWIGKEEQVFKDKREEGAPYFAVMTVFEDSLGLFSFLYICHDGCLAFNDLYLSRGIFPKGLALIQPGFGFGGNWTDFHDESRMFANLVLNNPAGLPYIYIYGGWDSLGSMYRSQGWKAFDQPIYYNRAQGAGISIWKRSGLNDETLGLGPTIDSSDWEYRKEKSMLKF